jgi:Putative metallopeptidase
MRGAGQAEEGKEGIKRQPRAEVPTLPTQDLPRSSCWRLALPFVLMFGTVVAQPVPSQSAAAPESSAPPEAASKVGLKKFQERIDAAALALRDSNPQFKNLSPKYLQGIAEFVSGNMLFVLLRELRLASIIQMGLPVVGRIEDAADSFAALRLIRVGDDFCHRVLTEAAKGWFLADRRDQKTGTKVAYYDEHGLNQQRAYQIVCLMVGSDDEKFNDLAKETKLPEARRDTCAGDCSNAAYSWDLVLKPHRRSFDQPKAEIEIRLPARIVPGRVAVRPSRTRTASSSVLKPCASRIASVQPRGLPASSLSARRCSALTTVAHSSPLHAHALPRQLLFPIRPCVRADDGRAPAPRGSVGPGPTPGQFLRCPERAKG